MASKLRKRNKHKTEDSRAIVERARAQLLAIFRKAGPQHGDVVALRLSLTPETDRGCALMATAYIDERLATLLKAYFVNDLKLMKELFAHSGPLGTFSSRIDVAYAVGLISSDLHREINLLRKIRNEFAHEHRVLTFESPAVKSRCGELSVSSHLSNIPSRRQFLTTLMMVLATLNVKIMRTRHRRRILENLSEKRLKVLKSVSKDLALADATLK